jgi:molybdenum cofactor cytidylyltransferase
VAPDRPFATGLVLAAGGSKRLGRPKQLLPYGDATLLDHVLDVARECPFDQLLCVIGGGAEGVRDNVELTGVEVVENVEYTEGCSSSIATALGALDPRADVLVLMLGDQPGVQARTVAELIARRGQGPLAVCAYVDGRGHPLAFARSTFSELSELHGDKAVWKLMDRYGPAVVEVAIAGRSPAMSTRGRTTSRSLSHLAGGRRGRLARGDYQSTIAAGRASTGCSGRAFPPPRP